MPSDEVIGVLILAAFALPIGWAIWYWWDGVVERINSFFVTLYEIGRVIILTPWWILKAAFWILASPILFPYVYWRAAREEKERERRWEMEEIKRNVTIMKGDILRLKEILDIE